MHIRPFLVLSQSFTQHVDRLVVFAYVFQALAHVGINIGQIFRLRLHLERPLKMVQGGFRKTHIREVAAAIKFKVIGFRQQLLHLRQFFFEQFRVGDPLD